jgi:hypothetical protein
VGCPLTEVERLLVSVRRRRTEAVPVPDPDRAVEKVLDSREDALDVDGLGDDHRVEVAEPVGPPGGVGASEPGDPYPRIGDKVVAKKIDQVGTVHR